MNRVLEHMNPNKAVLNAWKQLCLYGTQETSACSYYSHSITRPQAKLTRYNVEAAALLNMQTV